MKSGMLVGLRKKREPKNHGRLPAGWIDPGGQLSVERQEQNVWTQKQNARGGADGRVNGPPPLHTFLCQNALTNETRSMITRKPWAETPIQKN